MNSIKNYEFNKIYKKIHIKRLWKRQKKKLFHECQKNILLNLNKDFYYYIIYNIFIYKWLKSYFILI